MSISSLTGKRNKSVIQSAVSDHLLECNCSKDFDHVDILASTNSEKKNKFTLLSKEILLFKHDQPQLNKTINSFPLKLFDWDICCQISIVHKHVVMQILKLTKDLFE